MYIMAKFNREKFRQLRKQKKITIDAAANRAEIHRVTLSDWERGVRVPSEKNIRALAHAINVSVSEFSDLQEEEVSKGNLSDMVKSWLAFADYDLTIRDEQQNSFIEYLNKQYSEFRQASIVIKAILSSMQSIFYVKDTESKYITVNDAFRRNFSLVPGYRVLGKCDDDFLNSGEAKKNTEMDCRVLYSGKPIIKHEDYIPGTRKKKVGLISKLPIYDTDNKIAGVVSFFVDMTNEFKAEKRRKLLEAVLAKSSDVVWLVAFAPKKKLIFISDSVEELYGYPKEKFEEDYDFWWNSCVHPHDKKQLTDYKNPMDMKEWAERLEKKEQKSEINRYRIIDAKGDVKWIEENMFREKFLDIDCMCFIERNVTDRYQVRIIHELMTELFDKSVYYNIWLLKLTFTEDRLQFEKEYLYTSGNKVIEERYGHTKEEWINDPMLWHKLIHTEDKDRIETEIRDGKYPKTISYRIVRPDGTIRWLEDYLVSVNKDNNTYILGISNDLTDKYKN